MCKRKLVQIPLFASLHEGVPSLHSLRIPFGVCFCPFFGSKHRPIGLRNYWYHLKPLQGCEIGKKLIILIDFTRARFGGV